MFLCPFLSVFFFQVMTWVWRLRSLNMWRISPSLPPVCSRYRIKIKVESKPTDARCTPYNLLFSSSVWQNAELKFNFGGEDFKHTPKSGFVALDQAPEGHTVKSSQTGVCVWVQQEEYWKETEKSKCDCEMNIIHFYKTRDNLMFRLGNAFHPFPIKVFFL